VPRWLSPLHPSRLTRLRLSAGPLQMLQGRRCSCAGGLDTRLPYASPADLFWSWLGAFLGILAVAALSQWVAPEIGIALMVASFGASAVLIFGM